MIQNKRNRQTLELLRFNRLGETISIPVKALHAVDTNDFEKLVIL